jgi:hypothetical protein
MLALLAGKDYDRKAALIDLIPHLSVTMDGNSTIAERAQIRTLATRRRDAMALTEREN